MKKQQSANHKTWVAPKITAVALESAQHIPYPQAPEGVHLNFYKS